MATGDLNEAFKHLGIHLDISTATASRDLAKAVEDRMLIMTGEKAKATYRKRK